MVDGGAKLKMVAVPAKITDMLSELIDVCFWGKADMEFSTRRCLHMDPQRTSKSAMLRASLHAARLGRVRRTRPLACSTTLKPSE